MEAESRRLFAELQASYGGDHADTLKIADEILRQSKHDPDALQAKAVALIKQEQYTSALTALHAAPAHVREELILEHAYCLYRTHRLDDAMALVRKHRERTEGDLGDAGARSLSHLEAQLLYRLEKYDECLQVYLNLEGTAGEEESRELRANIIAVQAAATNASEVISVEASFESDSYEIAYNSACLHIANGDYKSAEELLHAAEGSCRESLQQEGYQPEEIEHELQVIYLQLACVKQMQGQTENPTKMYQSILGYKSRDTARTAIASNNLSALVKHQNILEATKLHRATSAPDLEHKLSSFQKRLISVNGALFSLDVEKVGEARRKAKQLADSYKTEDAPRLLLAAITLREKGPVKATAQLKAYAQELPSSLPIHLVLAQLLIRQNNLREGLQLLQGYSKVAPPSVRYTPGFVSLLVWLHGQVGEGSLAVQYLQDVTKFWQADADTDHSVASLKQLASYKLLSKQFREAATSYEQLVKADPTDVEAVAKLISAYAEFDPALAEQYRAYLPIEALDSPVSHDADQLEAQLRSTGRPVKHGRPHDGSTGGHSKKKRKTILPKNVDPDVAPDPERWLPKRDRAAFVRKGKNKKEVGRGPQGAAVVGGGIGGTGSANISGRSSVVVPPYVVTAPKPAVPVVPVAAAPAARVPKRKKGKK
ncbi:Signal recognition particle core component [Thoreauomyces humboldtii]|nr:Signal recognition particle core component [Thoreauomyces humboldtii]